MFGNLKKRNKQLKSTKQNKSVPKNIDNDSVGDGVSKSDKKDQNQNLTSSKDKKKISQQKQNTKISSKSQKDKKIRNHKKPIVIIVDNKTQKIDVGVQVEIEKNDSIKIEKLGKFNGTNSLLKVKNTKTSCSLNTINPDNIIASTKDVQQISKKDSNNQKLISFERIRELKKKVQNAIKSHKIFTIRGYFFSIRNALAARGWIEKLDIHHKLNMNHIIPQIDYEDLINNLPKRYANETSRLYLMRCERYIMSKFLENVSIDFLWISSKEKCDWIDPTKHPLMIVNKFQNVPFTSKRGLCTQLHDFHWFYEKNVSEVNFPRCYNVWSSEELNEFIENFRLTGSIGFLKYIVEKYRKDTNEYNEIFAENGKIPFTSINFALKRCNEFIEHCNHEDIDCDKLVKVWDQDWDIFLSDHYILTHENEKIQVNENKVMESTIKEVEEVLEKVKRCWPQYNLDGCLNIWIVKPSNKCRGQGIHLMNKIQKILNIVTPQIPTKVNFVVQKYIERPLIIHGTKFDIRQWFLVTCVKPLTIWMYKESYLRFSSQEYNLKNYHESVHLTNHAIQKKYSNGNRDERLPRENMWDCYTFQTYLRQIEQHEMWEERIYPGMKYAIIGTMLASQENMEHKLNTFELFGADFMLTQDYYPWLIEINSNPDFAPTTSITARMCPQCVEDIIKVIIDRRKDITCATGKFEMIYRQNIPPTSNCTSMNLSLKGEQILKH